MSEYNAYNAIEKMNRLHRKTGREHFVVLDCGEYAVTDDFGIDTFYLGCPIVASSFDYQ